MIAAYLLITYLLLSISYLLYKLFAKHLAITWRKSLLLSGIVISLLAPFAIDNLLFGHQETSSGIQAESSCLHQHLIPETIYNEYCPAEGEDLEICLEIAYNTHSFCQCDAIQAQNLLMYSKQPAYDAWQKINEHAQLILCIIAACWFMLLVWRLLQLFILCCTSQRTQYTYNNKTYTLLHRPNEWSVASFYLFKPYIIWGSHLNKLEPTEQNAILLHEIAHLKNRDTWCQILLSVLQIVWLFHPLYYKLKQELSNLNEIIADNFTIKNTGNPKAYAQLLVKIKAQQQNQLAWSQALTGNKSQLRLRIEYLLAPAPVRSGSWAVMLNILFIVALLTSTYALIPPIAKKADSQLIYQKMANENKASGKSVFCKNCMRAELKQ